MEYDIRLTDTKPFKVYQYSTPFRAKEAIEKEIETMPEQDIIRPSSSPYCSLITVVAKPDGVIRLCIDFRKMNRTKNARLLRYALSLQPFAFKVEPIKGTENCISDVLSRF